MGDPVTATLIVGTALQAYGTYQGIRASSVQAKYQAQTDRINAKIKEERIQDVKVTGAKVAKQIEAGAIQLIGEQATAFASGNIDISSSVVSEAAEGVARAGAADINTLQHNVRRDVWGLKIGIMNDETSAAFNEIRAKRLARLAGVATLGTILTGSAEIVERRQGALPQIS